MLPRSISVITVYGSYNLQFSSLQSLSHVWLSATPQTAARQASLFITNSGSLLKLTSIDSVMSSNHLILCHPLLLPWIFPSIRVFLNKSALHIRWPKCWSFSFSNSPSKKYLGLISFRIDWIDLLVVQGTLKSLLQHHSSKASPLHLRIMRERNMVMFLFYFLVLCMLLSSIIWVFRVEPDEEKLKGKGSRWRYSNTGSFSGIDVGSLGTSELQFLNTGNTLPSWCLVTPTQLLSLVVYPIVTLSL